MGINIHGLGVTSIYYRGTPIAAVYTRGQKVWPIDTEPIIEEIISCFARGYWVDDDPWTDDLTWIN